MLWRVLCIIWQDILFMAGCTGCVRRPPWIALARHQQFGTHLLQTDRLLSHRLSFTLLSKKCGSLQLHSLPKHYPCGPLTSVSPPQKRKRGGGSIVKHHSPNLKATREFASTVLVRRHPNGYAWGHECKCAKNAHVLYPSIQNS